MNNIIFRKYYILIFITLTFHTICFSQTKKDSLLKKITLVNENEKAELYNTLSYQYYTEGVIEKAIEMAEKALELAIKYQNQKQQAQAYKLLGLYENYKGNSKKGIELLIHAAEIYDKLNDKDNYANCLSNIGICYSDNSQMNIALDYYQKALKIREEYQIEDAALYTNIGLAYEDIGIYDKAYDFYIKALKKDEALADTIGTGYDYCNIGNIYDHQNNLEKAIEYYQKSYHIFIKTSQKEQIAIITSNLGATYQKLKNYDKALEAYLKSLNIRIEIKNPRMIANMKNTIGLLYLEQDNIDKAIEFFYDALKIAEQVDAGKIIAQAQSNLGLAYKKKGNYSKSIEYLEKSSIISLSQKNFEFLPEIYINMSDVWAYQNDFKKSLEYYKRYSAINDTLNNEKRTKTLLELQTRYETSKKEQEIALLKKDNELSNERNTKKNIIIIVSLILIGILIILAFISFRLYREKNIANEILETQFRHLNEKLQAFQKTPSVTSQKNQTADELLRIENSNGALELEVKPSDLFYISSLGNYLEIFWKQNNKIQKTMIRNTMKSIETNLANYGSFIRCHRSYIANLQNAIEVTGKSQNYRIKFNADIDEIPISRNFSKDVLERMNATF